MIFSPSALWWGRIRGLWKLPDGRDWLSGKLGLVLMGGVMLSESLIQFSVDGLGCVPSLLIDLRPNYGGGNEDNGNLLQKVPCLQGCTQCPQSWSRPPQPPPPPETPEHSRASLGQSLLESLLLSPGSSCAQGFVYALPYSVSPSCVSSGGSKVLVPNSSKRAYVIPSLLHQEPLSLRQTTADLYLCRRHSNTVLAPSLWGLWVLVGTRFVWALWVSLGGMGFDSKCDFAPPTVLLGLLLCPWSWGISSRSLQCQATITPAPTILLGLYIWNRKSTRTYCVAQGSILNTLITYKEKWNRIDT